MQISHVKTCSQSSRMASKVPSRFLGALLYGLHRLGNFVFSEICSPSIPI